MNMELPTRLPAEKRVRQEKLFAGSLKFASSDDATAARIVTCKASDESIDRAGDILVASGCDLTNFKRNPICLFGHDSQQPIARVSSIYVQRGATAGDTLQAQISFPPPGQVAKSDEVRAMIKAGILGAVSVGFLPLDGEPIKSTGGWKITRWELLELSVCAVPCNQNALITGKDLADQRAALRAQCRETLAAALDVPGPSREEIKASARATIAAARG